MTLQDVMVQVNRDHDIRPHGACQRDRHRIDQTAINQ